MSPEQFLNNLRETKRELEKFVTNDAPMLAANIAQEAFVENFQTESFFGNKWQEVQRRDPNTKAYEYWKKKNSIKTQAQILTNTGNLGRSLQEDNAVTVSNGSATITSDSTYGKYHNEGTAKLPKRQFMGNNAELDKKITEMLKSEVDSFFIKKQSRLSAKKSNINF